MHLDSYQVDLPDELPQSSTQRTLRRYVGWQVRSYPGGRLRVGQHRAEKKEAKSTKIHLPQEESLLNTASYVNLFNVKNREARLRGVYFDPLLFKIMDQEDYGMPSNLIDEFLTQIRALGTEHRSRGVPQFEAIAV